MSAVELGKKVKSISNPAWGVGVVEAPVNRRGLVMVRWDEEEGSLPHDVIDLKLAPGGDTESLNLGEEETMERLYNVEQSVSDAGGNLGLIEDFDIRENGVFYKVLWEDSRETWNVQGAIKPVRELKGTPTPKEVREVVEAVVHPPHYGGGDNPYEAIKVIEAWDLGFALGNVVKYVSRAGKKDATKELEDLQKAAFYLNRRIESLEGK